MKTDLEIGNVICSLVGTNKEEGKWVANGEYIKAVVVGVSSNNNYTVETIYSTTDENLKGFLRLGCRWQFNSISFEIKNSTYSYLADSIDELKDPILKEVEKIVEVEKVIYKNIKTFYIKYSKNEIHNSNWIDKLYNWYRRNKFKRKEVIEEKIIDKEQYDYVKSLDI